MISHSLRLLPPTRRADIIVSAPVSEVIAPFGWLSGADDIVSLRVPVFRADQVADLLVAARLVESEVCAAGPGIGGAIDGHEFEDLDVFGLGDYLAGWVEVE